MKLRGIFSEYTPYSKFLIVVGVTVMLAVLFTGIGTILASIFYGFDMATANSIVAGSKDPNLANSLLLIQFFSALGTFIIAPLFAASLFQIDFMGFVGFKKPLSIKPFLLTALLIVVSVPFINWMIEVNTLMRLPASLKYLEDWMKASEDNAKVITELFTSKTSLLGLLGNVLIIALLPAIGEELLFRGVIQRLFSDFTNSKHAAIIITAILFSAMHMQFYGFLPRFALGIALGYLMLWSGNLWLPILAHFTNNALAVIFSWIDARSGSSFNQDLIGVQPGDELLLAASVFVTFAILFFIKKSFDKKEVLS